MSSTDDLGVFLSGIRNPQQNIRNSKYLQVASVVKLRFALLKRGLPVVSPLLHRRAPRCVEVFTAPVDLMTSAESDWQMIYHLVMTHIATVLMAYRNRWFTKLQNGWIFPWRTVSHNQMVIWSQFSQKLGN